MKAKLAINPFTPSLDSVIADFTPATFTGSGALSLGTGVQPVIYDAQTGLYTINLKPPTGGYLWTCTVDPAAPETVYGVYLTDTAGAVLWGCQLFQVPETISQAGQGIIGDLLQLRFNEAFPN